MRRVVVFDTSIATDNVGDEVIMDAVMRELGELFPKDFITRLGTHDILGETSRRYARESDIALVGGTNLLCWNWLRRRQWQIGLRDVWRMGHPVLMGVGWRHYQGSPDMLTAMFLRKLLSREYVHSVRDSYTEQQLRAINIDNVVNTGCPTMWDLTEEHCARIRERRAENALITVTAYNHRREVDRGWIELVLGNYRKVYFWSQMFDDLAYAQAIAGNRLIVIEPSLIGFDKLMGEVDVDFVGTRLHGGIRALQHGKRTIIVEVDNRAVEIARDTKLPTMKRDDLDALQRWIEQPSPTTLEMPWASIAEWKRQFPTA